MGFLDYLLGRRTVLEQLDDGLALEAIGTAQIGSMFAAAQDPTTLIRVEGKITRELARQVPAVKRARDIIAGTLGTVTLEVIDTDREVVPNRLLDQPEADVPRSITMTRLVEDLFYEGVAWWRVRERDYRGYPVKVQRVEPSSVSASDGRLYVDGRPVQFDQIIRFDSPNGPLLTDGARAVRTLLALQAAGVAAARSPMPQIVFMAKDGADPFETDDDVAAFLNSWNLARQQSRSAYVSDGLDFKVLQFSPKDLQATEAQEAAVLDIARCTGIDAEDLSVSTTSRTYFNGQDRRLQRIADVLGPLATAITDRLRMPDVTPRGFEVRADFSTFLRADDQTRLANYKAGLDLGLYDLEDVAIREGLPTPPDKPKPPAIPAPPNVSVSQLPPGTPTDDQKELTQ